mgnify:CR=1 FL=1
MIISGLGLGMLSTAIPVLAVVAGIICSFLFASGFDFNNVGMGLYGIGIAAVGMLSTLGITLATDAYGPIATMPAAMRKCPVWARRCVSVPMRSILWAIRQPLRVRALPSGSAALTGLALLASYIEEIRIGLTRLGTTDIFVGGEAVSVQDATFFDFMHHYDVTLMNPKVLSGMFLGSMMAFLFCGLTMNAVAAQPDTW